jgi:hypothetical protein
MAHFPSTRVERAVLNGCKLCELLQAPKPGTLPSSNAAIYEVWPNGYSSCTGSSIAILPYEDAVPKIMLVQCSRAPLRGPQTVYNLVIIRSRHQAEQPRGAVAAWARTLEALHTFGLGRRHRDWSQWCRQSRQMQLQKASLSASRLTQLPTILTLQSK